MPVAPRAEFAMRVARECRAAADRLLALQDVLGDEVPPALLSRRAVAELQVLDTISQTLADLGAIFEALAADGGRPGDRVRAERVLAAAHQTSLRERLSGGAPRYREDGGDVDLF